MCTLSASHCDCCTVAGEDGQLAKEAAVTELVKIRSELNGWIQAFQAQHGQTPTLQDADKTSPELHKKFVRYLSLISFVRQQP